MARHSQARADKRDDGNRLPVIRQQFIEIIFNLRRLMLTNERATA